jgi:hypothetical protein
MSDDTPEQRTPAEARLAQLLEVLAVAQPAVDAEFAGRVARRARLQHAIAAPIRAIGGFIAALGHGARVVVGLTPLDPRR